MTQQKPEILSLIKENRHLFWYTAEKDLNKISNEFLVETILNYGDMDAVRKLIGTLGKKQTADIFFGITGKSERRAANFPEIVRNFFSMYFKKYV